MSDIVEPTREQLLEQGGWSRTRHGRWTHPTLPPLAGGRARQMEISEAHAMEQARVSSVVREAEAILRRPRLDTVTLARAIDGATP